MLYELCFAARLAAIGRFTGQAPAALVRRYAGLLGRYYDVERLLDILQQAPGAADAAALVQRALRVAAAETDAGTGATVQGSCLASVFSRLSLDDTLPPRSGFYRYVRAELAPQNAFPRPEADDTGHGALVQAFYAQLDGLADAPPADKHAFDICFDRICYRCLWCISATDYEGEDISLYDYMRVSEAIAACLAGCADAAAPYVMVAGDFQGIQKYIFAIASANHSGVAERLRARSFYVDVISRVFAQAVVDRFAVGRANILLSAGGKFYCLVPALADAAGRLQELRRAFDAHLYACFGGEVSVNLAWLPCADAGLEQYSDTVVELNRRLQQCKTEPFAGLLRGAQGWQQDAFVLCSDIAGRQACIHCGAALVADGQQVCPMCDTQLRLGRQLPHTRYIVHTRTPAPGAVCIFEDYYIRLESGVPAPESLQDAVLIEALGDAPMDGPLARLPVVRKYMANHIPVDAEGRARDFGAIASAARGMERLAVLKADVDVLGFLFSQGLRTQQRHFGTVSRVNTMSRMMEVFFSGCLQQLLQSDKYANVYSVFSGGDDLFLIGPWDVMLQLAVELRESFRAFVANNGCVTLSAAVELFYPSQHVAHMAEVSEAQLDRAKNEALPQVYPGAAGRNAACVMGRLISWPDLAVQLENAERLAELMRRNLLPSAILHRVSAYGEMYREFLVDKDIWKLSFEPMLHYDKQRNHPRAGQCDWFDRYILSMQNAANFKEVRKNLFFAPLTVKIAMNMTRKERS